MRNFQQLSPSSESDLITALIQCLSPERRRELLDAAAQSRMLELIEDHQARTVEEFLRAVQSDPHWSVLKDLLLSQVITTDRDGIAESNGELVAAPRNQGGNDARQMKLPSISTVSAPVIASDQPTSNAPSSEKSTRREPRKGVPPTRKSTGDILDDIVMAVTLEPGLRSEEIRKRIGKPAVLVKSSLRVLRKVQRLRTEGERRNTRYFAPR
jgi:hypothetical protein